MTRLMQAFAKYGLPNVNPNGEKMADVFNLVISILGAISVLIIVIAGIQFMTAAGEPDKVSRARNAIIYAVIGLIIAIFSAAIVNFVIKGVV